MFNLAPKSINYISAFTGSGKTYTTCDHLSKQATPFIYAVPTLVQVEEVKAAYLEACKRNGTTPNTLLVIGEVEEKVVFIDDMEYTQSVLSEGRTQDLVNAIGSNVSVICSHTCFIGIENKAVTNMSNYRVVLDEVNTMIKPISLSKFDFEMMTNAGLVSVASDGALQWLSNASDAEVKESVINTIHPYIVQLIKDGRIFKADQFYVEEVPHKIFVTAQEVLILAYMFESTYMYHHFNALGFTFNDLTGSFYKVARFNEDQLRAMAKARLVVKTSRTEPMKTTFGGWSSAKKPTLSALVKAVESTRKKSGFKYEDAIFTCPKSVVEAGSVKFGKAEWVYSGARGTEAYIEKTTVLVLLDKHMNPALNARINQINPTKFTKQMNDAYALQEMIQFIWRSNIRDVNSTKPVTVYFASHRMHKLFMEWLNK